MKRIIYLVLALFILPSLHAENTHKQTKDSLLRIYATSPADTSRLEALYNLALLDLLSPTFIYYEDKLLKEAIKQSNVCYQSTAIYGHVVYYYNRLEHKNTIEWMNKLEKLADQHNYYKHYFKGKKILIEFYIISQKVELALIEAQKMYDKAERLNDKNGMREACLCLLTGYFNTLRYKEGLKALDEALRLTDSEIDPIDEIDLLTKAVLAYSYLHDNKNLYHYLNKLKAAKEKIKEESSRTNGYANLYLLIEIQYALYYSRTQQAEEARLHLEKAEKYMSPSTFLPYRLSRLAAYAEYYQLTKDYEKALTYLDEAIDLISPISTEDAQTYGIRKANLLAEMGRSDDALPIFKQIAKSKDSLYTIFSTSQIEQIQSIYNMDNLILQKEKRQKTFHQICLYIFIIIILTLLYFNLRIYGSRKRLEQDEMEMRKHADIAEKANEVKSRFLANMSYNIRIPLNNVVGFSQLLSTDAELSEEERKEYSSIIQSNSTELIQLVNDVLDLSRLEANMMKFQLQNYSIEEWCNDLSYTIKMHGEGVIQLQMEINATNVFIYTDVNRLTQITSSLLLYPDNCKEPREVKMSVLHQPEKNNIICRIENSPIAESRFISQKISVRQKINQLFFEHFGGTYKIEEAKEGEVSTITFTYPTLS